MFEYSANFGSINRPTDLPTGDYIVVNSLMRHREKRECAINIFSYEHLNSEGERELVCVNFLIHKGNELGFKEAVLANGLWRNEEGQITDNISNFLPDDFLDYEVVLEEDRKSFTLTDYHKVINIQQIN
ncbi:hypothetical protein M2128_000132 [Polynucleobacter sphagniphilus]|uniref:hypothetical protein n=1 Tax=Polynucleobacter sphagniphilus TaxID=1743169 RepID=UPI0024747C18|nr:hypothetical protein [Polynucleobacter sphagniphilus]MDH6241197.1 hypothetical protein [Polynucleobacter sphagniphilus]MDH6301230.1 hypothetical protein [Polynucleobacter sphagniphilus]